MKKLPFAIIGSFLILIYPVIAFSDSDNIQCKEGFVLIFKINGNDACVKPTSVYPLLQRGWASHELTDTGKISIDVASWFIKSSPTFSSDGMEESLNIKINSIRESFPEQYVIEAEFSSRHGGYGDREDKFVTQAITPHTMDLVVSSGNVVSAIIDEEWDELNQKLWGVHNLPDVDTTVTQNSDAILGGDLSVQTSIVNYDGTSGFLAQPSDSGNYPGVIMIHEWWGLNDNIKDMASELASHGYVVLAVDLFGGEVATDANKAMELVGSFDQNTAIANMNLGTDFLTENYNVEKIGSIGWCFGGGQSLNLALNNENMDATVIYYGQLTSEQEQLSSIDWPILGIFAELDQGIPPDKVNEFESTLNNLEIPNEIIIYPGVDHAFANPTGTRYAPVESADAWDKTLNFLESNLK
jgi:carboxymethylenebutenolidase